MKLPEYIHEDRYIYYSAPWAWLAYYLFLPGLGASGAFLSLGIALLAYHLIKVIALLPIFPSDRRRNQRMQALLLDYEKTKRRDKLAAQIKELYVNREPYRVEDLSNPNITRFTPQCSFGKTGFGTRCQRPATKRTTYQGLATEMVWCSDHYPKLRNNGYGLENLPSHPDEKHLSNTTKTNE